MAVYAMPIGKAGVVPPGCRLRLPFAATPQSRPFSPHRTLGNAYCEDLAAPNRAAFFLSHNPLRPARTYRVNSERLRGTQPVEVTLIWNNPGVQGRQWILGE